MYRCDIHYLSKSIQLHFAKRNESIDIDNFTVGDILSSFPNIYERRTYYKRLETHYKNNNKFRCVEYYTNGQILSDSYYRSNKHHGEYRQYYMNGNINYIQNFVDGKLNGKYIVYDKNGLIISEENYLNDKHHGINKYYEPNQHGKIAEVRYYENGQIIDVRCP